MPLNEYGQEIPDPTPIAINIRQRKITKFDDVRSFIRRELSEAAARGGMETIDEANDFDIEDDPIDPTTPWETWGDEQAELDQKIAQEKQADRELNAKRRAARKPPPQDQTPGFEGSANSGTHQAPDRAPVSQPDARSSGKPSDSSPT